MKKPMRYSLIKTVVATAAILATQHGIAATSDSPAEISVAYVTGDMSGLVPQVALANGFFKKHDLEVKLVAVKSGPEMVSALVAGAAEFSGAAPQIAFPAIASGAGIVYLMSNYDLDYSLLAQVDDSKGGERESQEVQVYPPNADALKGKRIGVVGRGGLTELFARKIAQDAGLNPDRDISIIAVGAGLSAVAAFQNNQIDVLVSLPPTDTMLGAGTYQILVANSTARKSVFGKDFISTGVSASSSYVESNPNATLNYCKAFKDTIDFMRTPQNRDNVVKIIAAKMNLPETQAGEVFDSYRENYDTRLTKSRWESMATSQSNTPTWEAGVYHPCAAISATDNNLAEARYE